MGKVKHVNTDNARSKDQREELARIQSDDFCPFCSREYMETEHPNPIITENDTWFATKNRWQYRGSKHHILLIHKDHIDRIDQMSESAWIDLKKIFEKVVSDIGIDGATLVMRQGESRYTGATVTHLHAQIISGYGDPDKEPVLARVG